MQQAMAEFGLMLPAFESYLHLLFRVTFYRHHFMDRQRPGLA